MMKARRRWPPCSQLATFGTVGNARRKPRAHFTLEIERAGDCVRTDAVLKRILEFQRSRDATSTPNSGRDDVPSLEMFIVTAVAVLSSLTVRLLAFLHDTFLFTDLCMRTAAYHVAKVKFHTVNAGCERGVSSALRVVGGKHALSSGLAPNAAEELA